MFEHPARPFADSVTRAAMMLLGMSMRAGLERKLLREIEAAAAKRGGRLDDPLFVALDLHVVLEAIATRAVDILSAALCERLSNELVNADWKSALPHSTCDIRQR